MALAKYLKKAYQNRTNEQRKEQLVKLRKEPASARLEKPTRLDRARNLGYKAKQGYFIVRQRVKRGGHERPHYRGGKKPSRMTARMVVAKNYRQIAEQRAAQKYPNCEVLNSYFITKDGTHAWYEVIMVDPRNPAIVKDKRISWIANPANRGRVFRGLTSAGKKGRGLRNKGKGAEKIR